MGKALYRKYRSRGFDEVVGQSHVTDLLKNAIETGKIAHAYLLTGPRGTGKTSVARIIAHAVNDLEYSEDTHLDIIEIDAASNRRIDDIRDLREKVHIAPVSAKFKVYIIDEVHMLTPESFNALLKTLEEPPSHVIFILATTEVHKVPATIVSRTQRYHFRPALSADITQHLAKIAKLENIPYELPALELIAIYANGSFRDSMSLLDQLSGLSETLTAELVESVLGMAPGDRISALTRSLREHDVNGLLSILDSVLAEGVSPVVLVTQISRSLSEIAREDHSVFSLLDELVDVPKAHDPQLKLITTLVKYARVGQTSKTVTRETTERPSKVAKEPIKTRLNPEPSKQEDAPKKQATSKEVAQKPADTKASSTKDFNWDTLLTTAKKHNAPLHSVLSRAKVKYNEQENELHLSFSYALHRKKIENPIYKKQLSALLRDIFGLEPLIIIGDGKNSSTEALSAPVKAVADIMGGGEVVDAKL